MAASTATTQPELHPGVATCQAAKKSRRAQLDSAFAAGYGGRMTQRIGASLVVGAALLLLCAAGGCRQPKPTYEYEETETTITTTPPPGRAVTTSTLAPKSPTWKRGEAR